MYHLYLFFHILSFAVGIAAIVLFLLLYAKTRTRLAKYNFILLFSCNFYMAIALSRKYMITNIDMSMGLRITTYLPYFIVMSLLCYILPRFFHALTGSDFKRGLRRFWDTAVLAQPLMVLFAFVLAGSLQETNQILVWEYRVINNSLFVLILFYCLAVCLYYYQSVKHDFIRLILKAIFIVTVIFLPGIVYDVTTATSAMISMERSPFLFSRIFILVWNLSNIVLLYVYFQRHVDLSAAFTIIPQKFLDTFLITAREKEVIELLLKKNAYSIIGEKLFISTKTVERHVSNIYRKTGSKSREDLLNRMAGYL